MDAKVLPAQRRLGGSGASTPPLALGGNVFGWTADEAASFAVLDRFVDGGGRLIDTADIYSAWVPGHRGGESETVIGSWLARGSRRDEVLIASKFGMRPGGAPGDISPAHLARAVDGSLRRLRIERIDLYFIHCDVADAALAPTLRALDGLVRAGKIGAIGASNFSASRLEEAMRICSEENLRAIDVVQPLYNLLDRGYETELQPVCARHGLAVTPYYGLAAGFLTGKYRTAEDAEGKSRSYAVKRYATECGFAMLQAMDAVAAETGASLAQIALAWLAAKPTITAPIASATSPRQLDDLLGALRLTLSAAQMERLDRAG